MYNVNQLLAVIEEDGCDKGKKIIIEVGGERISLQHVFIVDQEMVDEGTYKQYQLGSLVLDLDV